MKKMFILLGWAVLLMTGCLVMLSGWDMHTAAEKGVAEADTGENVKNITNENLINESLINETLINKGLAEENINIIEENINIIEENIAEEDLEKDLSIEEKLTNDNINSTYCYGQLSAKEQELYTDILRALTERIEEAEIPADTDEKVMDKVFQCVSNDHPELFYVDGYTVTSYQEGGTVTGQSFCGSYQYSSKESAERLARIEQKAMEIQRGAPKDHSEYETVRYVYEYLIRHTEYALDAEDNQNICSVFLNGRSVCQGYAKAAQYLLGRLGINAILVSGTVNGGQEHAWNIVQVDGHYYHMDVTWGDASYIASSGVRLDNEQKPQINYEYLCVPDEQLLRTHRIQNIVPVPVCDSMEANYYVKEGIYFTEPDMKKAEALFERAYEQQADCVTLKCASTKVYEEMKRKLIDQQAVFAYLKTASETVIYTVNEEQMILSFWLRD